MSKASSCYHLSPLTYFSYVCLTSCLLSPLVHLSPPPAPHCTCPLRLLYLSGTPRDSSERHSSPLFCFSAILCGIGQRGFMANFMFLLNSEWPIQDSIMPRSCSPPRCLLWFLFPLPLPPALSSSSHWLQGRPLQPLRYTRGF